MKTNHIFTLLFVLVLFGSGCAISKNLEILDGETRNRGFSVISGSIHVGENAKIGGARLIAGGISIEKGSRTRSLSTIAGEIKLGPSVVVDGNLNATAGSIHVSQQCEIHGNVSVSDGTIRLRECQVNGDVIITTGDVSVSDSQVKGSLIIKKAPRKRGSPIRIEIGANSEIDSIVSKDPLNKITLRIHETASVGSIEGLTAEYF